MYNKYIKRFLDFIFAACLLVAALPVMVLVAIVIKREDPLGPVLFRQHRIGKDNTPFIILKFRSMKTVREENGMELSDKDRLLKSGRIIRKLSLDELPQLINVIKGDMSFIGPRPLPVIYYSYYTDKELERHKVMPGISGLAQVNGRNNLSWEDKFKYDLYYVEHMGLMMDLRILSQTLVKLFRQSDVKIRTSKEDRSLDAIRNPLRENVHLMNKHL